jgi:hypothetical protein
MLATYICKSALLHSFLAPDSGGLVDEEYISVLEVHSASNFGLSYLTLKDE